MQACAVTAQATPSQCCQGLGLHPAGMFADLRLVALRAMDDLVKGLGLRPAGMFADLRLVALRAMDDLVKGLGLRPAGMFADLRLVALCAMDDLVDAHRLVLASSAANDDAPVAYTDEWMASARWHPFWLFAIAQVLRANASRCSSLGC